MASFWQWLLALLRQLAGLNKVPARVQDVEGVIVNDDLELSWTEQTLDIGGQPANVIGYKIYAVSTGGVYTEVADVVSSPHTLEGYIADPAEQYPVAVAAYNTVGEGPVSITILPVPPSQSVPAMVEGVTATIIPK